MTQASWSPQEARTQGKAWGRGALKIKTTSSWSPSFCQGLGGLVGLGSVAVITWLSLGRAFWDSSPLVNQNPQCASSVPPDPSQKAAVGTGSCQTSSRSMVFLWAFVMDPKTQNLSPLSSPLLLNERLYYGLWVGKWFEEFAGDVLEGNVPRGQGLRLSYCKAQGCSGGQSWASVPSHRGHLIY